MEYFLIIFAIVVIIVVIYGIISNFFFTTTIYNIHSKEMYEYFGEESIILLSDLHNVSFGHNNTKLIKAIDDINPKVIVIAGDMVNHHDDSNNKNAKYLVERLSNKYQVIYADGNHEQGLFDNEDGSYNTNKFDDFYKKNNKLIHLTNNSIRLGKICVYGLMIGRSFYRRFNRPEFTDEYLQNTLGKSDKNCYNILIAHNPMYFENYVRWGANLVLSGHVHGGFVRIPGIGGVISPQFKIFPKYSGGLYRYNKGTMILSRGLGNHTIRFRVFNSPQIIVLTVNRGL